MSYKILTKNGIDNSNIDGARGEYFNSGMRDGIVQGVLNEGTFIAGSSNVISLDTCELRIAGHRIVIDEPVYHTFSNAPSTDTRYAYVAQIIVGSDQSVDFSLFVQTANTPFIQNDLYKNITGAGTYQVEIGRFTLLTDGTITDVVRTIDVITGGSGKGGSGSINVGNVITEKIETDFDAEVDIDTRYEEDENKEYIDFKFSLPIDMTDTINKSNQALENSQTALENSNNANSNSQTALENSNNALTNSQNAVTTSNEAKQIAEQALEQAQETGTKVTVNGEFQKEFNADTKANKDGKYSTLISGGNVIVDTRDVDNPPSYYANQETCCEFKSRDTLGLINYMPNSSYVTLTTKKGWKDDNYVVYQEAVSAGNDANSVASSVVCYRYGINDTWGEWQVVGKKSEIDKKLDKVTYEYNKEISFGSSGYLYIGKFPIYDTGIFIDISCTTNTTYSGKLVIACQNYAVKKASVYGDYSNTVTPNIYYKVVDNTVEVYFKPQAWSKNVIHITGCGIQGEVTHVCEKISAIPTDATLQPENAFCVTGDNATKIGYYEYTSNINEDAEISITPSMFGFNSEITMLVASSRLTGSLSGSHGPLHVRKNSNVLWKVMNDGRTVNGAYMIAFGN